MKVLFINRYENSGGAAIAGQRIGAALEKYYHTENHFIAGTHHTKAANVTVTRKGPVINFIERGWNVASNLMGLQYLWFPFSSAVIMDTVKRFKPDVISLHNIHGGYFDAALLPKLSQYAPIVWTLHDMWAITANAAHTFGDTSWKAALPAKGEHKHAPATGINNGKYLIRRKQRLYAASDLYIVSPAEWLYNMTKESPLTKNKPLYHIPNPIDTDQYLPQDKASSRAALGLTEDWPVISFVSERLFASEFKGGKELLQVLSLLDEQLDREVYLLMIGKDRLPVEYKHLKGIYTGYVHGMEKMMQCYSASDIFIYPTKADTLPNVLIEAGSCATPCVTFDVGGCAEIVRHGQTGYVVRPGDYRQFAGAVLDLLADDDKRAQFSLQTRKYIIQHFGMETIAAQYHQLFAAVARHS